MNAILISIGIIGNVILVVLLLWREWYSRLPWFTFMSALAVVIDCLAYFIHGFDHSLYNPLRIFMIYWLFPILEFICAWEAFRVRLKWLEWLMLIQVAVALVGLFAYGGGNKRTIYQLEIFADWLECAGIILSIWKFRGERLYEPH